MSAHRTSYLTTAPLVAGDTVAIIAPSGPCTRAGLRRAVGYYESWGLKVVVGEHVLDRHSRSRHLAGEDDARRADLVAAWTNPDVDAVACVRGGYGAMRLLDGIDWGAMQDGMLRRDGRPTLLTGSSDITALHEAFRVQLDVAGLFCPMPSNDVFRESEFVRADVHRWLFEPWAGRDLIGPKTEVLVPGSTAGRFSGGNLSLVAAALGAAEAAQNPGGILFLEDIDEEVYRLDNLLVQLQRAGRLSSSSGIVLGSWLHCGDADEIQDLLAEYLGDLDVPVLWEQGFGHDPHALSVPMNIDGVLDASGQTPRLTVSGPA
ncbi:S66 peptidase family protein [Microterricola viridarii]|uniref:LD-carboxypeptidase n=1 Tax=Microterricola viridarii TaxID=412690 RepID=A0A109QWW0_9MICO|nr:LD-carboxypeptidase [Microterricola viridarii]AMB58862.1 LD-carboxypeptidase [Microterricola viridarii]